jgi:hypothetical protein
MHIMMLCIPAMQVRYFHVDERLYDDGQGITIMNEQEA